MTITMIQKTKGSVEAKQKSDIDLKVERLIELKVAIDAIKSSVDEYEKLRKELSAQADAISVPNEQVVFTSEAGDIAFSPRTLERKISDMPKVFEFLGADTFIKLSKITMTDIDKYLGESEKEQVIKQELTGARKISVLAKEKVVTTEAA